MEDHSHISNTPENSDIAQEEYRGPSATIAALGQGAFEHLKWAIIGLFSGGILALIFPGTAQTIVNYIRSAATKLKIGPEGKTSEAAQKLGGFLHGVFGEGKESLNGPNGLLAARDSLTNSRHRAWMTEALVNKEHGFGSWFTSHVFGNLPFIGKSIKRRLEAANEEYANAITLGGALAAGGYIGGWMKGLFTGASHSYQSRNQFQRAKDEIMGLRHAQAEQRGQFASAIQAMQERMDSAPSTQVQEVAHSPSQDKVAQNQPAESWAEHTQAASAAPREPAIG